MSATHDTSDRRCSCGELLVCPAEHDVLGEVREAVLREFGVGPFNHVDGTIYRVLDLIDKMTA